MAEKTFTVRSLIIGLVFGSLVAAVNTLLVLTVGIMITAAFISVVALCAYSSFFKAPPPSSKEAVTSYTVHQAAAFAFSIFPIAWIFLVYYDIPRAVGSRIPDWILPDSTLYQDVLAERIVLSRSWGTPLAWMVPVALVSGIAALMVVIWLRDHLIEREDIAFPGAQADIEFIKSVITEKTRLDYLFYGLALGFFFDFIFVHYPTSLGVSPQWLKEIAQTLRLADVTPYIGSVLPGASLCIIVSVGFIGLGMLMSPKSTVNMAGSAVAFYVVLSFILASRGSIETSENFSSQWLAFRYPYGLSLSLGLLLTAALAPIVLKIASPLISGSKWKWKPPFITVAVFGVFCLGVLVLASVLSMGRFVTVFPLSTRIALLIGIAMIGTFVLAIVINARIAGETGIVWMSQYAGVMDSLRRWAVTGLGATGFEGFAITESLQGTRFAAGHLEALKVGKAFDVNPKHQYMSALFGWCFGFLLSTISVFLIWNFYGIGGAALPMVNMQTAAGLVAAFASGQLEIIFNSWFVLIGFIIGVVVFFLQKQGLPFVVTAVGIGAFMGPMYVTTFFVGGLIRFFIEKVKGSTWVHEKGNPFSAGLVLGGIALAPLLMVVVNLIVSIVGGG